MKAGAKIPVAEYTKRLRVGGAEIDDVADLDRILDLVAGGATMVMQGLQRTWPPLVSFCRDLERTASHPVQANAYLSPPNAAGLSPHADRHDVIVLQVAGSKFWNVDGLGDLKLGADDAVYFPAGTSHSAWTTEGYSLHLTIGILSTTKRQVLHRIIDRLDADFDAPLPLGYANLGRADELIAVLADTIAATAGRLAKVSPDDEASRQIRRQRLRVRDAGGRLSIVVDPDAMHDGIQLRRRQGAVMALTRDDDGRPVVELADRRLRFPDLAADALAVVESHDSFAVQDLAGLDVSSRAVLARRLVREGLLEVAEPEIGATGGDGVAMSGGDASEFPPPSDEPAREE